MGTIRENFAFNLKRLARARQLSRTLHLSKFLEVPNSTVHQWWHGLALPDAKQWERLRAKFGVPFVEFVRDPEDEPPPTPLPPSVEEALRIVTEAALKGLSQKSDGLKSEND